MGPPLQEYIVCGGSPLGGCHLTLVHHLGGICDPPPPPTTYIFLGGAPPYIIYL